MLGRFNRWDRGYSSNYFARLIKATIHRDAQTKIENLGFVKRYTAEFLGFTSSTALCDILNIPLLPFQETDALAKRYAVKFSDDLAAQTVIDVPDADLKFEVVLRDIDKSSVVSSYRSTANITRTVVLRFIVSEVDFSGGNDRQIINTVLRYSAGDKLAIRSREDDTPERDYVMFDRLIYRTLTTFLSGLIGSDESALADVNVKRSAMEPSLPKLSELLKRTRT